MRRAGASAQPRGSGILVSTRCGAKRRHGFGWLATPSARTGPGGAVSAGATRCAGPARLGLTAGAVWVECPGPKEEMLPRRTPGLVIALVLALLLLRQPNGVLADDPDFSASAERDVSAALARTDLDPSDRVVLELLQLVNEVRAESGLPPYLLDGRLTGAAGEHAADMAAHGYCRHTGSDGSSSRDRMARSGYPYNNWAGENILCSRRTPEQALAWWMRSGPHRRNILHRHYTHIGIGYDPNGRYGPVWTLNFAAGAADAEVPAFALPAGPETTPGTHPQ
jgi:hypothetical protein